MTLRKTSPRFAVEVELAMDAGSIDQVITDCGVRAPRVWHEHSRRSSSAANRSRPIPKSRVFGPQYITLLIVKPTLN